MTRPVHHKLDVYGTWLHVVTTSKQWRRTRARCELRGAPKKIADVFGQTCRTGDPGGVQHVLVYVDDTLTGKDLLEVCAHEAAHAAGMVLDDIGETYNGNSEALAYLVGWLTTFIWEAVGGNRNPVN